MSMSQGSSKRISRQWKRAAKYLGITALAGSSFLSAFAPRDALADFTLHYEGKPFDADTCYANAANFKVTHPPTEVDCLAGSIELSLTYAGSIKADYNGDLNLQPTKSSLVIKGDDYTSYINIKSLKLTDGKISYSNISFSAYNLNANGSGNIFDNYDGITGNEFGYEIFVSSPNKTSYILHYGHADGGTWTITGDVDGGGNPPNPPTPPTPPTGDAKTEANEGTDCQKEQTCVGNPISVGTGNKFQVETDYAGPEHTGLELIRYYNSQDTRTTPFGANWRSTWDREIVRVDDTTVKVIRENGRTTTFTKSGDSWSAGAGVTLSLRGSASSGWTLVDYDDNTETYSGAGKLQSLRKRSGETTTLSYGSNGLLSSVTGPYGHTLTFQHDSSGFVNFVTLPDGKTLAYQIDGTKNLTQITYADNTAQQYVYGESVNTSGASLPHALTGIIDGNGSRFATYRYDAQNRAIETVHANGTDSYRVAYNADGSAAVTDANNNQRTYGFTTSNGIVLPSAVTGAPTNESEAQATTYDANGFVASKTDFKGNVTTYTHNARGQETSRTEAAGTPLARTSRTTWHPLFNLPVHHEEPSAVPGVTRVTAWQYNDSNGALLGKTISAGDQTRSWAYENHDEYGHPGSIIDPMGGVTTIHYDSGAPSSITNALGQTYSFTRDGDGRVVFVTDPNGLTTNTLYTAHGEIDKRIVGQQTTDYDYDDAHDLSGITTPDNAHVTLENDAAHQLVRILDALGNHHDLGRDQKGNVVTEQVFDASGALRRQSSHGYDAVSRLVQNIGALGQTSTYVRDGNGDVSDVIDPEGHSYHYERDALRRVTRITAPDGGVTTIAYNPDDSLAVVTDPNNSQTRYGYDGLGNQTSVQSPDSGRTTRTFDTAGHALTETDARGITSDNDYDLLGRLRHKQYSDGTAVTFEYDSHAVDSAPVGRLTSVTDASGRTDFWHDRYGHVIRKVQQTGDVRLVTQYNYDEATGQLRQSVLPSGAVVDYAYDSATGKPTGIRVNGNLLIGNIQYDPFGAVAGWQQGNGQFYERKTDVDGRVETISHGTAHGTQTLSYEYNLASRVSCERNTAGQCLYYEYDPNGRVQHMSSEVPGITDEIYAYDLNGNRTWSTSARGDRSYDMAPGSNQLEGVHTQAGNVSLGYDPAGNVKQVGPTTYTFGATGQLTGVKYDGIDATYIYNAFRQRVKKTVNGTSVVFAQAGAEVTGVYRGQVPGTDRAIANQETIFLDGLPVGVVKAEGMYYVNPARLGEAHRITDQGGQVVWKWEHGAYGDNAVEQAGLTFNRRMPGEFADSETGWLYNNNRFRNLALGRYISPDPIGLAGGMNPYAYVDGDPVNNVDPEGLKSISVFPIVEWVLKKIDDKAKGKGMDLLYEEFWNAYGVPVIGDKDYSQVVKGMGACLINLPGIYDCGMSYEKAALEEANRKLLLRNTGKMCMRDEVLQSFPDTSPEYYMKKYFSGLTP